MKTLLIGLLLISALVLSAYLASMTSYADDWFCTEESSQRSGTIIKACGVAESTEEGYARKASLEAAQGEFNSLCQASSDCVNHPIHIEPGRTDCSPSKEGYKCFRLISYEIMALAKPKGQGLKRFMSIMGGALSGMGRGLQQNVQRQYQPQRVQMPISCMHQFIGNTLYTTCN